MEEIVNDVRLGLEITVEEEQFMSTYNPLVFFSRLRDLGFPKDAALLHGLFYEEVYKHVIKDYNKLMKKEFGGFNKRYKYL